MAEEEKPMEKDEKEKMECCPSDKWQHKKWHRRYHRGGGMFGFFGFLAFIGVAVYNVQQVSGFWPIVLAILKAIVWPAFLLYKVFSLLGM